MASIDILPTIDRYREHALQAAHDPEQTRDIQAGAIQAVWQWLATAPWASHHGSPTHGSPPLDAEAVAQIVQTVSQQLNLRYDAPQLCWCSIEGDVCSSAPLMDQLAWITNLSQVPCPCPCPCCLREMCVRSCLGSPNCRL